MRAAAVDERRRYVAVAACTHAAGMRMDFNSSMAAWCGRPGFLRRLCTGCRRRGVLACRGGGGGHHRHVATLALKLDHAFMRVNGLAYRPSPCRSSPRRACRLPLLAARCVTIAIGFSCIANAGGLEVLGGTRALSLAPCLKLVAAGRQLWPRDCLRGLHPP